jgi:hypothetical protein
MNAARQRRKLLQEKIRKEHEDGLRDRLLEEERLRTLCPHNILREQCVGCEEISDQNWDAFMRSPFMMETRLRRQLGVTDRQVPVYVFLKFPPGCIPRIIRTYVRMSHAATDVAAMKRDGFWAIDHGYLTNFNGDQIAEISFATEED